MTLGVLAGLRGRTIIALATIDAMKRGGGIGSSPDLSWLRIDGGVFRSVGGIGAVRTRRGDKRR